VTHRKDGNQKISIAKHVMIENLNCQTCGAQKFSVANPQLHDWELKSKLMKTNFFFITVGLATKICFRSPIVTRQPKCEQGFSYIHLDGCDGCIIKMDANVMLATKWVHHIGLTTLMRCCPRINIPILI
jgi:hypothetical protein